MYNNLYNEVLADKTHFNKSSTTSHLNKQVVNCLFLMLEELRQDRLSECINVTLMHNAWLYLITDCLCILE